MLGSQHIIHTTDWCVVGCRLHLVRIRLCFLCNLSHHSDEGIQRLLRLILRWLNHQRFVEEQWEVDGGSMIAIIQQTLRHIHRGDTRGFILQAIEHELMTAHRVNRQFIDILQRLLDVVGIEGGKRTHVLHLLTA